MLCIKNYLNQQQQLILHQETDKEEIGLMETVINKVIHHHTILIVVHLEILDKTKLMLVKILLNHGKINSLIGINKFATIHKLKLVIQKKHKSIGKYSFMTYMNSIKAILIYT